MSDCCSTNIQEDMGDNSAELCPSCNKRGKKLKIITLKSLLKPTALEKLNGNISHYFCSTEQCEVVYFDTNKKIYLTSEIKVPVYQKDKSSNVPICYCFDWTKEKIKQNLEKKSNPYPADHIRENIKENRCGCEVNNPQGSCCLGNITDYIKEITK